MIPGRKEVEEGGRSAMIQNSGAEPFTGVARLRKGTGRLRSIETCFAITIMSVVTTLVGWETRAFAFRTFKTDRPRIEDSLVSGAMPL
jgi:hypothetical protein